MLDLSKVRAFQAYHKSPIQEKENDDHSSPSPNYAKQGKPESEHFIQTSQEKDDDDETSEKDFSQVDGSDD